MNGLRRIRSSLSQTFFSSTDSNINSNLSQHEECFTLNRPFAPYERFDLSTGQQQQNETSSSQTLNPSNTSIIDTSGDNVEFLVKDSKRTLDTISGVFCPIALSMFAISIFMRIGFVLAHAGILETLIQLGLCFLIIFCTLLSVCALATNGAIEGGGVYHMISRALGPEFGGSIGVLFFFANILGNGQSVAALVEALVQSFGPGSKRNILEINQNFMRFFFLFLTGKIHILYETHWWRFLYGTIINLISLLTCLLGSSLFSVATVFIFILVCFIYLMVVISFFICEQHQVLIPKVNSYAYQNELFLYNKTDALYGYYTGFNLVTWKENIYANYTIDYTTGDMMNFATVFGILFSSITGLLAGANMSGKNRIVCKK